MSAVPEQSFFLSAEFVTFEELQYWKLADATSRLIIIDMNRGEIPAIQCIKKILFVAPSSKTIAIIPHPGIILLKKLIAFNVKGFITFASTLKEFSIMLKEISRGYNHASEEIHKLIARFPICNDASHWLSNLENQILNYMNQGLSARVIAKTLGVTLRTVEMHRYNILMKLQLPSYAALSNLINSNVRKSKQNFSFRKTTVPQPFVKQGCD